MLDKIIENKRNPIEVEFDKIKMSEGDKEKIFSSIVENQKKTEGVPQEVVTYKNKGKIAVSRRKPFVSIAAAFAVCAVGVWVMMGIDNSPVEITEDTSTAATSADDSSEYTWDGPNFDTNEEMIYDVDGAEYVDLSYMLDLDDDNVKTYSSSILFNMKFIGSKCYSYIEGYNNKYLYVGQDTNTLAEEGVDTTKKGNFVSMFSHDVFADEKYCGGSFYEDLVPNGLLSVRNYYTEENSSHNDFIGKTYDHEGNEVGSWVTDQFEFPTHTYSQQYFVSSDLKTLYVYGTRSKTEGEMGEEVNFLMSVDEQGNFTDYNIEGIEGDTLSTSDLYFTAGYDSQIYVMYTTYKYIDNIEVTDSDHFATVTLDGDTAQVNDIFTKTIEDVGDLLEDTYYDDDLSEYSYKHYSTTSYIEMIIPIANGDVYFCYFNFDYNDEVTDLKCSFYRVHDGIVEECPELAYEYENYKDFRISDSISPDGKYFARLKMYDKQSKENKSTINVYDLETMSVVKTYELPIGFSSSDMIYIDSYNNSLYLQAVYGSSSFYKFAIVS